MRKLLLLFLMIPALCFSQKFEVTPGGLKDVENTENSYIVLEFEDLDASELYEKSLRYVNEMRRDADESIKGSADDQYLRFSTFTPTMFRYSNSGAKIGISCKYDTELKFKDNRVRLEFLNIDMEGKDNKVLFTGNKWRSYPVFQENGKLFKKDAKKNIEDFFNLHVILYMKYMQGDLIDDEW